MRHWRLDLALVGGFLRRLRRRSAWQWLTQYIGGAFLLCLLGLVCMVQRPLIGHFVPGDFFLRKSHDWLHILEPDWARADRVPLEDFLLIYIDDRSHAELQQPYDRTWHRGLHAALLQRLNATQPKMVFYDIIFDQPSSFPEADAAFAEMMAESGRAVLGASSSHQRFSLDIEGEVEGIFAPIPEFRRHAMAWGMHSLQRDADNGLRRMGRGSADGRIPPAFWVAATALDPALADELGEFDSPRWLHYPGPAPAFPHISFSTALLNDQLDCTGKYVFVGARHSVGLPGAGRDAFRSPYLTGDDEFTGVDLQANMFWNLLSRNWLRKTSPWIDGVIVVSFGLLLAFVVNSYGPRGSTLATLALSVLLIAASLSIAYVHHVFYAWLVPVTVQAPVALIWANACNYYFETRKRRHLKRAFSSYLSPIMVERMAEAEEAPQLGGQEKIITPFFSDVEGFSAFSEILTPSDLTELLNEYLGAMTEAIQAESGTLDKYIGDAIVAIFGAPLDVPDHAARACYAAARMQRIQLELQGRWAAQRDRWPERVWHMRTRIGLNTGPAVVGNMGSPVRFNYTMAGDVVNLAARCEAAAKQYGIYTMVTAETRAAALAGGASNLLFRQLDRCAVVGRQQPVDMFELMGFASEVPASQREAVTHYEKGLERYLEGDWEGAAGHFNTAAPLEQWQPGRDWGIKCNPSLVMLERCQALKSEPPTFWEGVYRLDRK